MRTLPLPANLADDDPAVGYLDWKDQPHTVLEMVDHLLEPFGLEVVEYDTGADDHQFKIEKRIN